MTQNAATMAMKIKVVWTMGSGMPIVATAACLLCGHRGGRLLTARRRSGWRVAAAAVKERCQEVFSLP